MADRVGTPDRAGGAGTAATGGTDPGATWTPARRSEDAPSAPSLLLTLLGEFVLPGGGGAWTGAVVDAMSLLGVEEAASRQALARSSARGLLLAERVGRRTRWALTERATRLLTEGAERIYGFGAGGPEWDGRWLLVLTTVPEHTRHMRARLRARMGWIGLGQAGPGMWVSPWADREGQARAILEELDLAAGALSWVGRPGAMGSVEERVGEIWDLDSLAAEYERFTSAATTPRPETPEEAFAALALLVHRWRHFPATDPGLPDQLLPPWWPARDAAAVFAARRREWSSPAWAYWRSLRGPAAADG